MEESDDELLRRMAELEERVVRLEGHSTPARGGSGQEPDFWVLDGLKGRIGPDGGVVFAGLAPLPSGETYEWQMGARAAELMDGDWSDGAEVLEALGHPVRLLLLQRVLSGTTATAELKYDSALGTTGQLYHHLRRLVSAGWLRAEGRGHYRVPPTRVVPLLTVLLAARR